MKKAYFMFLILAISLIALSSLASAQYYGGYNNDYNRRTYSSTYENNGYFRATDYDKSTSSNWIGGQYVTTTNYVRTTRESPSYNNYRGYGMMPYGYSGSYNSGFYPAPNYPWYQRYWSPTSYMMPSGYYGGYGMMNSYPRNYYVYNY